MLLGYNTYLKPREALLQVLNIYKDEEGKWGSSVMRETQEEVEFLQQGGGNKKNHNDGSRKNSKVRPDFFHCEKMYHLAYQCPNFTTEKRAELKATYDKGKQQHSSVKTQVGVVVEGGVSMLVKGDSETFKVLGTKSLKTNHVYLDSCLTNMKLMNTGLLTDVHESETFLYGHCNSGTTSTNLKGKYGSIDCWLNEEGIANIFIIPVLKNLVLRITYNSNDDHWCVSKGNIAMQFKEDNQEMLYIDVGEYGLVFSQTMHKSYKGYTNRQVKREIMSCKELGLVGHPYE